MVTYFVSMSEIRSTEIALLVYGQSITARCIDTARFQELDKGIHSKRKIANSSEYSPQYALAREGGRAHEENSTHKLIIP